MLLTTSAQAALSISTIPTANVNCAAGVCTATAKKAVLNVTDLTNMLVAGSVAVQSGDQAQDITVDAPFSWTSSNALTLDASRSLTVNKAVADTGTAALTLSTGTKGELRFGPKGNISFLGTSNSLTINDQHYTLVDSIASLASAVAANQLGLYALAHHYDASVDGTYSSSPIGTTFEGMLEGLGNVISNLKISVHHPTIPVGFIAEIGAGAIVRDIGITAVSIKVNGHTPNIGALVGEVVQPGAIYNSYASGKIKLPNVKGIVGGLVGTNNGTIHNTHADVDISSINANGDIGGLVGSNGGVIEGSFASGVIGLSDTYSGGLIGANVGQVLDCYASGTVESEGPTGGLIGGNVGPVSASYSTGHVEGNYDVGGFVGADGSSSGSLSDTYWNLDTSGIDDPSQGAGNVPHDRGIKGLTDAQLKSKLPSGFDLKVWAQNPKINNGYPYLINNPPAK